MSVECWLLVAGTSESYMLLSIKIGANKLCCPTLLRYSCFGKLLENSDTWLKIDIYGREDI